MTARSIGIGGGAMATGQPARRYSAVVKVEDFTAVVSTGPGRAKRFAAHRLTLACGHVEVWVAYAKPVKRVVCRACKGAL